MRVLFSIVGLLVVVFIVMQLAGRQLQALAPAGPSPGVTAGGNAAGAAPATAPAVHADRVRQALEQGAAARASDAAGR